MAGHLENGLAQGLFACLTAFILLGSTANNVRAADAEESSLRHCAMLAGDKKGNGRTIAKHNASFTLQS
jgi:hypothetical protein